MTSTRVKPAGGCRLIPAIIGFPPLGQQFGLAEQVPAYANQHITRISQNPVQLPFSHFAAGKKDYLRRGAQFGIPYPYLHVRVICQAQPELNILIKSNGRQSIGTAPGFSPALIITAQPVGFVASLSPPPLLQIQAVVDALAD